MSVTFLDEEPFDAAQRLAQDRPVIPGKGVTYLDEEPAGATEPPPRSYIEDQSGRRVYAPQAGQPPPQSFIAQPATGRKIYFDPNAIGAARTREGVIPGAPAPITQPPPPAELTPPPAGPGLQGQPQMTGVTQNAPSGVVATTMPGETMEERQRRETQARAAAAPVLTSREEMSQRVITPDQEHQAALRRLTEGKVSPWMINAPLEAATRGLEKIAPKAGITKTARGLMDVEQKIGMEVARANVTSWIGKSVNAIIQHVAPESDYAKTLNLTQEAQRKGMLDQNRIPLLSDVLDIGAMGPPAIFQTQIGAFILPVMTAAGQTADAIAGVEGAFNPQELATSAVMAGILKSGGGIPRAIRERLALSGGGVVKRVGKALVPTGAMAGEMAAVRPIMQGSAALAEGDYEEFKRVWREFPQEWANTFAAFVAIGILPLAKAGLAGEIETKLGQYGLEPNEARRWANTIAYNPAKVDVLKASLGRKWATALDDAKMEEMARRIRRQSYDQESQGRMAGIVRRGQEPGGPVSDTGKGPGATGPGGDVQAHAGGREPAAAAEVPRGGGGAPAGAVTPPPAAITPLPSEPTPVAAPIPAGPAINIPARSQGGQTHIIQAPLEPNKTAESYYAWVDLDDPALRISRQNNASTYLQERNRNRQAYLVSRAERLQKFDATRTADSQTSDYGSPIIDMVTGNPIAGYGRLDTLEDVYKLPDTDPRKQALINYQNNFAARVGLGPRPPEMQQPFLARIVERYSPNTDAADFAKESNRTVVEQMSDAELAMSDAKMILDNKLLDVLSVPESGELISKENQAFMSRYIDAIQNRAPLTDSKGALINEKVNTRLQRALLTILMQEHPEAVEVVTALTERAGEYGLTDAINGLAAASQYLVRLKSLNPTFDLTSEISSTMPVIMEAKRALLSGEVKSLEAYFGQIDFYRQATPEQQKLVMILVQAKSAKWLREVLREYAEMAEKLDQKTLDMFAGVLPESKKIDIINRIIKGENLNEYIQTRLAQRGITQGGPTGEIPAASKEVKGQKAGGPIGGPAAGGPPRAVAGIMFWKPELLKKMNEQHIADLSDEELRRVFKGAAAESNNIKYAKMLIDAGEITEKDIVKPTAAAGAGPLILPTELADGELIQAAAEQHRYSKGVLDGSMDVGLAREILLKFKDQQWAQVELARIKLITETGGPDKPAAGAPTQELELRVTLDPIKMWNQTPRDFQEAWGDAQTHVEEIQNKNKPAIDKLVKQIESLKGQRGKEISEQKKALLEEIDRLQGESLEWDESYQTQQTEALMAIVDEAEQRARKMGVPENQLEDFRDNFGLSISTERPYIEYNWEKPVTQIFDEVVAEYEKAAPVATEPAVVPGAISPVQVPSADAKLKAAQDDLDKLMSEETPGPGIIRERTAKYDEEVSLADANEKAVYDLINSGAPVELDNGWVLGKINFEGQDQIELRYGGKLPPDDEVKQYGLREQVIGGNLRLLASWEEGLNVVSDILGNHSAVRTIDEMDQRAEPEWTGRPEELFEHLPAGKSAFRQRLEAIAESKAGVARANKVNLIQREIQNKAQALIEALDAGRITEAEAQNRFQATEALTEKALAKAERERQKAEPKAITREMFEGGTPAERGMLFDGSPEAAGGKGETPAEYEARSQQKIEAAARVVSTFAEQNKVMITPELVGKVLQKYGDKFKPLYNNIARVAGEMLTNKETDIWFGMRGGKLDEGGEKGRQNRPVVDSGTGRRSAVPGAVSGNRPGGRTDIKMAGGGSIPRPPDHVGVGSYDVDEDQRLGINLGLDRFIKGDKGFLLGDGTGVGKTSQILVMAHEYAKRTGEKVLIITQNVQTIQGSFLDDAARLGFNLKDFDIGTYSSIRGTMEGPSKVLRKVSRDKTPERAEIQSGEKYGLVILDEAHNLKNSDAKQTIKIMRLIRQAKHAVFATATPMDTPTGAAYFLGEITGIPRDRMARMLGFEIRQVTDPDGKITEKINLIKGFSWKMVKKNLVNLREVAIKQGAIIRREYPFLGKFEAIDFNLSPADAALQDKIIAYYDAIIEKLPPGKYQGNMKGVKLQALSHWLEAKKIPILHEQIKKTLAEGRRAVVVCAYVNPSDRLDRPAADTKFKIWQGTLWDKMMQTKPEIRGPLEELGKLLDADGIKYAQVYGAGPKAAEVEKFQKGKVPVVLMTAKSGGTGINLDDQFGDAPRDLILATTDFAGDVYQQTLGRINRRNTVNAQLCKVLDVYAIGAHSDDRRREINKKKQEILTRIQQGEDIDLAGFNPEQKPAEENLVEPDVASELGAEWPGAALGEPKVPGSAPTPADDPNYSALPIELPELVQFSRALLGGKYPEIRQKLGRALGRFTHEGPEGNIKILARVFKLITPQEEDRMRQEATSWAETQAEPGDDIPTLIEERFNKIYNEAYELAKTKNPLLASKVLAHEIGHVVGWLPDHIVRGRGNILGQIASFVEYTKKQLSAIPSQQDNLLDEADRKRIRAEAQRRGRDPNAVKRIYAQIITSELKRRGIVTYDEIYAELEPLVAWWRGSGDTMEPYFKQPHEMYAETLSVLLNNPAAVKSRAPKFYKLFTNWLTEKPEVKRLYDAIQDSINSGQIYKNRVEIMYREMAAADQAAAEWATTQNARTVNELKDAAFYTFDRRFGPIQRRIATIKDPELRRRALGALSDGLYRGALGELIMDRVQNEVVPKLADNNFQWINLGEYLLHQRIQYGDRANIGNPWGMNPKTSAERLAEMRRDYGPDRYTALEEASLWLRSIYEEEVLAPAREWEIYGDLQQMLEDNVFYATFAVFKNEARPGADSLQAVLEQRFGNGVTGHIFKQYGTLKPVKNPATSTVQKMLAIGSMIYRERAKFEALYALLNSEYANEWRLAEKQWTGKRQEIKIVENERVGTLIFFHQGKLHGFYGPRSLVDAFSFRSPIETMLVARTVSTGSRYIKGIFTSANPAFWPVAFIRDVRGFNRRMPGTATQFRNWIPFSGGVFGRYAFPAMKAAISTVRGRPNAIGAAALRRGMVISRAAGYMGMESDDEFDRDIKRRGLPVLAREDLTKVDEALNYMHKWMEQGQIFERTVKIAGMMYLDDVSPDMPEELKRIIVRKWAGSPDFLEKGAGNWMADQAALFYNPAKEGLRSEIQAWKGFNGEKGRSGEMFWNTLRWTILPRLALAMLLGGGLAALVGRKKNDRTEREQMYQDGPSERDRRTYHCIPLAWIDKKERKALYLRWPLEENERMISAATDTALQAVLTGEAGEILPALTDYAGRQLPGLNPLVSLSMDWIQYAMGGNPFIQFRGRNVLTDDEQVIRGVAGLKAMGRHIWNSTLGSLLGQIPNPEQSDDIALTIPEKILRAPVISQVLGRWLRISNAGWRERLEKASKPVAQQEAQIRMEVEQAVIGFKKTGQLHPDAQARLVKGKYLYDRFKDAPLTPELALQRYYYTHWLNESKKAAMTQTFPADIRIMLRQPTTAQKMSVAGEIMNNR